MDAAHQKRVSVAAFLRWLASHMNVIDTRLEWVAGFYLGSACVSHHRSPKQSSGSNLDFVDGERGRSACSADGRGA